MKNQDNACRTPTTSQLLLQLALSMAPKFAMNMLCL